MGDIARCSVGKENEFYNEELLYKMFGVNAELLIDHAWGWEPCTIADVKAYQPEHNSVGAGQVLHCPYDAQKAKIVPKPQQQAGVGIGPYGKPNPPPKPAGAQRSVRACGREGWAGIDARTISKWGPPPRLPGQRLAKRKARKEPLVKFSLCPMTSEFSTAQKVWKSDGSPARAHADVTSTE